ncbi:MAG TPA: hypothetical protein VLA48_07470 [Nitrososphaeraceae archaeon]|nr:hypothetical protein [Nitrososphaeraceae archaeon]
MLYYYILPSLTFVKVMGRTILSIRIAAILEEKEWKYLNKKNDKKAFDDMFSTVRLYNSACSYAVNLIRI